MISTMNLLIQRSRNEAAKPKAGLPALLNPLFAGSWGETMVSEIHNDVGVSLDMHRIAGIALRRITSKPRE
jgi:hypothetical protein